ncbi:20419_t:CDS:2 [Funneliformis geosporum]|uniref:Protein YIP n=1 Tax=Funneliformis geosporum TaxID=1117311 RepID=A0A9W4SE61_9GLOM|nr:20419_t:CDS:2 [Funneliformis geosporum]CAI2165276.1 7094_t:CDS:2 [Funneliformis geosporum]
MSRDEYSVVVEVDDESPVRREELEFQDFSSTSGVGGNISQDKQANSSSDGFNNATFFDPHQSIRNESQGGSYPLWSIEYYAQYFDVDTDQVLERASKSLFPKDNFNDVVGPNPDLYATIAKSIAAIISKGNPNYDITILSFGFAAIYTYSFVIPFIVWGALKYLGCRPSLLNTIGLYGYGLTIWLPISVDFLTNNQYNNYHNVKIINVIPSDTVRWALVIFGFAISGFFISRNLYPVISRADSKTSRLFLIFVIAAHAAFSLLLKFKFFSYQVDWDQSNPKH